MKVDDPRILEIAKSAQLRVVDISSLDSDGPTNHNRFVTLAKYQPRLREIDQASCPQVLDQWQAAIMGDLREVTARNFGGKSLDSIIAGMDCHQRRRLRPDGRRVHDGRFERQGVAPAMDTGWRDDGRRAPCASIA